MNPDKKNVRPESYPRPTETDNQLKNQPEFIDDQPNEKNETDGQVSDKRKDQEERRERTEE